MSKHITWTGIAEVDQMLKHLEKKTAKKVARSAIVGGLGELRKEIKKRAPRGATKRLSKSIKSRFRKSKFTHLTQAMAGINVGSRKGSTNYVPHGHLVALGTKQRSTPTYRKKKLAAPANRGKMPAKDFVKQGAIAATPKLVGAMTKKAAKTLEREILRGKH